jgi:CRISPR-associated protein Cas2
MSKAKSERRLFVIAYDMPNNRRRTKVHKLLSGIGTWTQYSLFECYLDEKEYLTLRHKLDKLLKADEDSVRFYPLCAACTAKVETIGSEKPAEATLFLV